MASFLDAGTVVFFNIYLLSPTSLHQPPERNTHDCKVLLNVQQFCKSSSNAVWSSLQLGTKAFCQNKDGESLTLIWHLQSGESCAVGAVLIPRSCHHRHGNLGCPDDVAADAPNTAGSARSAALHIPPPSFSTLIPKNLVFFILPFPFLPVRGTSRSILITRNS